MQGMEEELTAYLAALERDACYRVDRVLKSDGATATELVFFVGANGSERGPYLRKRFAVDAGLGRAYQRIWDAQRTGGRFVYLPRIEECYTTGDELVVISEYVRGETLAEVVYRCDPSVALAADVFPRLCDAVSELHGAFDPPIIHRDLKPSNIILSQNSLTLIDFGIARTYDEAADADTHRFGTRAYAPPEQFGFGQTDVRSDVYALGLLLYYLLTEKNPDVAARRRGWRAVGVSEPLRAVIDRAASFDPANRFSTVEELKEAFTQALAGQKPQRSQLSALRAVRSSLCSFIANIPPALGVAWDVALALFLVLLFAASVDSAFNPPPDSVNAAAPLWLRMLSYFLMYFLMIIPLGFVVCDRRPLRAWIKPLERIPLTRQIAIALAIAFVGFCATGISTSFF